MTDRKPNPAGRGYPASVRRRGLELYREGLPGHRVVRRLERERGVSPHRTTVHKWARQAGIIRDRAEAGNAERRRRRRPLRMQALALLAHRRHELSIAEVAERVGVAPSTIKDWKAEWNLHTHPTRAHRYGPEVRDRAIELADSGLGPIYVSRQLADEGHDPAPSAPLVCKWIQRAEARGRETR